MKLKYKYLRRGGQLHQRRRVGNAALESRTGLGVETDNALALEQFNACRNLVTVIYQSDRTFVGADGETIQIIPRYGLPFNRFNAGLRFS